MATKSFLYNPTYTRGIRNNNPGNLRKNKANNWQGKINSSDKDFEQFINIAMGLRASMITLRTYQNKHNLKTIRQIINRWAPNNENKTEKYISAVAGFMGLSANSEIDLSSKSILIQLTKAIVKHECSPNHELITESDYFEAYDLIGGTSSAGSLTIDQNNNSAGSLTIDKKKPLNWFAISGFVIALLCTFLLFKK